MFDKWDEYCLIKQMEIFWGDIVWAGPPENDVPEWWGFEEEFLSEERTWQKQ